jgi:hypothetical protein
MLAGDESEHCCSLKIEGDPRIGFIARLIPDFIASMSELKN